MKMFIVLTEEYCRLRGSMRATLGQKKIFPFLYIKDILRLYDHAPAGCYRTASENPLEGSVGMQCELTFASLAVLSTLIKLILQQITSLSIRICHTTTADHEMYGLLFCLQVLPVCLQVNKLSQVRKKNTKKEF